jgi:hypothetical protein
VSGRPAPPSAASTGAVQLLSLRTTTDDAGCRTSVAQTLPLGGQSGSLVPAVRVLLGRGRAVDREAGLGSGS